MKRLFIGILVLASTSAFAKEICNVSISKVAELVQKDATGRMTGSMDRFEATYTVVVVGETASTVLPMNQESLNVLLEAAKFKAGVKPVCISGTANYYREIHALSVRFQ